MAMVVCTPFVSLRSIGGSLRQPALIEIALCQNTRTVAAGCGFFRGGYDAVELAVVMMLGAPFALSLNTT